MRRIRLNSPSPSPSPASTPKRAASPSTPSSPSPSPSASTLPQPAPAARGESAIQRQARAIVRDVQTIIRNWDLAASQCADAVRKLERARTKAMMNDKKQPPSSSSSASASKGADDATLAMQSALQGLKAQQAVEAACLSVLMAFDKLDRQYSLLRSRRAQAQQLLVDAASKRGLEHAFLTPCFATWPWSRFNDSIDELVQVYSVVYHSLRAEMQRIAEQDGIDTLTASSRRQPQEEQHQEEICRAAAKQSQHAIVQDFLDICKVELGG